MAVFEIFYKQDTDSGAVDIGSVMLVKHGFYLPYCLPFLTLLIAIRQKCFALGIWSAVVIAITLGVQGYLFYKVMLFVAFALVVADIKRFDFAMNRYINGGRFIASSKNEAIARFFATLGSATNDNSQKQNVACST